VIAHSVHRAREKNILATKNAHLHFFTRNLRFAPRVCVPDDDDDDDDNDDDDGDASFLVSPVPLSFNLYAA